MYVNIPAMVSESGTAAATAPEVVIELVLVEVRDTTLLVMDMVVELKDIVLVLVTGTGVGYGYS